MAKYPGTESERRVPASDLMEMTSRVFAACGMSVPDAELLADSLVAADLRGIHSHGVLRVPDYVKKLTREGVDPRGRPRIVSRSGGAIVVDGGNSMGQIGSAVAMDAAIEAARETKVAIAALGGSNHCGAMDYWAMKALPHDMIGIASSNALATMAPWGGVEKIVGMNPIAVALPSGDEPPIVLDVAFGATAHGKIRVYAQKGHPIPEGWAYDKTGQPTTDATAALEGLIQPIGGHKGIGLAIVSGMLATLLSGAGYGTEAGNMVDGAIPGADGQFFMAIDVSAFQPVEHFKTRADRVSRQIQDSAPASGVDRLYPPGLLEAEFEAEYRRSGIPLNDATLDGIRQAGLGLGIPEDGLP